MSTLSQFTGSGGYGAIGDFVPFQTTYMAGFNQTINGREYLQTSVLKNYNNTYLTCVSSNKMFGWYNVSANGFDVSWYTPILTYVTFKMERAGNQLHYINLHQSGQNIINVKFGVAPNLTASFTQANISQIFWAVDSTTYQNVAYISGRDVAASGGENMVVYRCGPPTNNTAYIRVLTVPDSFNTTGRFIVANSNTQIIAVRQQGLTNGGAGSNVYNSGMIATSTDGVNWVNRTPNLITSIGATLPGSNTSMFARIRRLTWAPVNNNFVYLMEDGSAFFSDDGYTLRPAWSIANAPLGMVGTYWNTNFGNPTWSDSQNEVNTSAMSASSPNTTIFVVGHDSTGSGNRLLRLTAGNTWNVINLCNGITSFAYKDLDNMFLFNRFASGQNKIIYDGTRFYMLNSQGWGCYSLDEGLTWQFDYRWYDSIKNVPTGGTVSVFAWGNVNLMNTPTLTGQPQVFAIGQIANPPTPYDLTFGPVGTPAWAASPGPALNSRYARQTPDLIGYQESLSFYGSFTPFLRIR